MPIAREDNERYVLLQALPGLSLVIQTRKDALLTNLVQQYRAGVLSDQAIWGTVGALSELDAMLKDTQVEVDKIDAQMRKDLT